MKNPMMRCAVLIASCLFANGCSLLAATPDRSRFFTLTAPSEAQAHHAEVPGQGLEATPGIVYGLGPITLPAYLDRSEVATRVSPSELTYSPTDLWAGPLTTNVSSVLLQNLFNLLEGHHIVAYPWDGSVKVDYQVAIRLLRFERNAEGESQLAASWAVKDVRNDREVLVKETTFTRPGPPGDTPAAAAALSATLGDLSHEIAAALRELPPPRRAPTPAPPKEGA